MSDSKHQKSQLEAQIESLEAQIEGLRSEIGSANEEIASTQIEIKKAGEDRELENKAFQTTLTDQRATQEILTKALAKLQAFYKKGAFVQTGENQSPPVAFEPMNSNSGASPVIALIEKIITDSKETEAEAIKDEKESQANYEKFVKDATAAIKALKKSVEEKSDNVATAQADKESAASDLQDESTNLEELEGYRADLHAQCDFLVKNFDLRAESRTSEIEAIQEAKAILSGAK